MALLRFCVRANFKDILSISWYFSMRRLVINKQHYNIHAIVVNSPCHPLASH